MTLTIKNYGESLSNGFSFEWNADDGFLKTTDKVNAQGSTTFLTDGGEHDVTLVVNGGNCGTSEFVYNVRRSLPNNAAIAFDNSDGTCVPGNTSYGSLVLTGVDATNKIKWGFVDEDTHGWEILENNGTQNTTRPNVNVGTTGITVSANSYYCPSAVPIVQFLAVTPSAPQLVLSENFCLEYKDYDASTAVRYEVKPDPLAVKWEWTFPDGWTSTEAEYVDGKYVTYTNSIDIIPDKDQSGYVYVKSYGLNGCSSSSTASRRIGFIYPKPQLDIIDGCPNPGGEITMRLTEAEGFTANRYYRDLGGITKSLNNGLRPKKDVTFTVLKDRRTGSYAISVHPQGSCDVTKSTTTYNVEIETTFYIDYGYDTSNASKRSWYQRLTAHLVDSVRYTGNCINWVVQKIQDGNVYYSREYVGYNELRLKYTDYKPGETVHIITDMSAFDNELDGADITIDDEGEETSRCHTVYEFDFTIDKDAKGDLFLSGNKMLSIAAERSGNLSYSLSEVKVYPNPTSGVITVELPAEDDYSLRVADISGKIVAERQGYGKAINVDLAGHAKGSYPFQLKTTVGSMSNVVVLK